eukprot:UN20940
MKLKVAQICLNKSQSAYLESVLLHPTTPPFRPHFSKNKGGVLENCFSYFKKFPPTVSLK